ncbi:MAG TPA: hypothetical protein VF379_07005 [Gaiellaceae bacterium]
MQKRLDELMRDVTLVTLAFAIASGYSLYQLAHGVATFVDDLTTHYPPHTTIPVYAPPPGEGLTWVVGHRLVTLDSLFVGLIELALVVLAAVYVKNRSAD